MFGYLTNNSNQLDLVFFIVVIAGTFLYTLWRKFSLGRLFGSKSSVLPDSQANSEILAYYTSGHNLIKAARGKLGDMPYALYATMPQDRTAVSGLKYVEENAAIYVLDLPFNTQSHFIGLSKDHHLNRLQFESFLKANGMEKVELEGDFPDYFDIYAITGQQFQVRAVLAPNAMECVVDYCRSHFWEINNAELYFVVTNSDAVAAPIIEESQKFVTQIKPALMPGVPGAPVVHHEVPYGEYEGPTLLCPICAQTMTINDSWHSCPAGHGILISGRNLMKLHNQELQIPAIPHTPTKHGQLKCPNCHNPLFHTNYEGSSVQIDSCENCPFRWIDANEIALLAPIAKK